jgi:hypothetical protein
MRMLSDRLEDVRIIHGSWDRCLNMHYGDKGDNAAIFFDPPYLKYEKLYAHQTTVAIAVARWCAGRPDVKIALCGHVGDYDEILKGWDFVPWSRGRLTYGGSKTTDDEVVVFSPACKSRLRSVRNLPKRST